MISFVFLFPDFSLHSGPETPTYTSFSLRLLLDQPPYWHQLVGYKSTLLETEIKFIGRISSSGMLRYVALVRTDVSEERSASIIRVTRISELGKTLTVLYMYTHTSQQYIILDLRVIMVVIV
jgi:hypothetical protein